MRPGRDRTLYDARCSDPNNQTQFPSDPDDNRILECAVASKSDYIVTGEEDLLRLGDFEGIRIVSLSEFLELHSR